ncbi:MAG: putative fatty-acid--CoA ligase [Pseudonocardiales bacterium]|nr:putative fatty-acid--CoA ligase [Pseudonocardiales bacterium]
MQPGDVMVPITAADSPFDDSGLRRSVTGGWEFADLEDSIVVMLASVSRSFPDREALVELDGLRMTYRELWQKAGRVAGGLTGAGLTRGGRVAIVLPNGIDWCLAFFGTLLAGGIAVPVNPKLREHEVTYVLDDCSAEQVIRAGDVLPDGPPVQIDGIDPGDVAALFYTSGTTGSSKGAALSHRNILSAVEAALRSLQLPDSGVRTLVPVPLFHVMGALNQLLPTLRRGGTAVIMASFDVVRWVEAMTSERIDVVSAVPAIYWQALRLPEFAALDPASVGWVIFGGAATPPAQVAQLRDAFPAARLFSGYGLTETAGGITGIPHEAAVERSSTVGVAIPSVEFALLGPDAAAGLGELLVRAPQVMTGYWQRPEATAEVMGDGWLRTGDAVRVSLDGFVQIVDRLKDTIIRGGENVYCVEVESILAGYPAVGEIALIAVPDERLGERIGAVVVPTDAAAGGFDTTRFIQWATPLLATYKLPEFVHVRSEPLPRNAAGKVEKTRLRAEINWPE